MVIVLCVSGRPDPGFVPNQVYADRYMELLDVPAELSAATADSGFQISVQMTSSGMGPYACLVFHDPVPMPLTVGELQQQFSGPYTDFTATQVTSDPECGSLRTELRKKSEH